MCFGYITWWGIKMKDDENLEGYDSFTQKFKDMDIETLRLSLKYLNYIPDILREPLEIWLDPETNTALYFQRVEGDVTIIVKTVDSVYQEFEAIQGNHDYVNSLRRGVLIYHQKI